MSVSAMPRASMLRPRSALWDGARFLDRRWWVGPAAVALLLVLLQVLLQPALSRLTSDAPLINVAGRQRMLSQKLAKSALALTSARTADLRERFREELGTTLAEWKRAHRGLQAGDAELQLPGQNSLEIREAFSQLIPHFDAMASAADRLLAHVSGTALAAGLEERRSQIATPIPSRDDVLGFDRGALETILTHESEYLRQMHDIVGLFEQAARSRAARLQWTGWGLAVVMLLAVGMSLAARRSEEQRRRELLTQLAHADRLRSMGEMAASLAHEINQPLGAIANYAEGCLARPALDPALSSPLRAILRAAIRGGEIIRRVRGYVRLRPQQAVPESLNDLVRDVELLCRPEAARRDVVLECRLADDLPRPEVDGIQIQQVLTNLVQNALAACERHGGERPRVVLEARAAEGAALITVTDNGPGVPAEMAESIFEPFVTTRAEGTGMGLAIARGIVESHGGRLWLQPTHVGARFCFTLPAGDITEAEPEAKQAEEPVCA